MICFREIAWLLLSTSNRRKLLEAKDENGCTPIELAERGPGSKYVVWVVIQRRCVVVVFNFIFRMLLNLALSTCANVFSSCSFEIYEDLLKCVTATPSRNDMVFAVIMTWFYQYVSLEKPLLKYIEKPLLKYIIVIIFPLCRDNIYYVCNFEGGVMISVFIICVHTLNEAF